MDRTKTLLMSVTASALLAGSNPTQLNASAMRRKPATFIPDARTTYDSQTPEQIAQASQIISDLLKNVQEEHAMSLNELVEKRPDLDRASAEKAIADLLKQGKIRKTGDGSSEKPFRYYDKSHGSGGG